MKVIRVELSAILAGFCQAAMSLSPDISYPKDFLFVQRDVCPQAEPILLTSALEMLTFSRLRELTEFRCVSLDGGGEQQKWGSPFPPCQGKHKGVFYCSCGLP